MNFFHVLILGIVEGITEFLPISSTAHLEIVSNLLGILHTDFVKSFEIVIQLGAILAVVVLYGKRIIYSREIIIRMVIGFIPTGIIGFILYFFIKKYLLGNAWIAAIALFIGGLLMLAMEHYISRKPQEITPEQGIESLSYVDMIKLGIIQSLAIIPGVSRSGAIIVGGMFMRIPRTVIIETAFILAIPTMAAAAGYDLLKSGTAFTGHEWMMLSMGLIITFIVSLIVIRWLLEYVRTKTFKFFGWYRIILALVVFAVLFIQR